MNRATAILFWFALTIIVSVALYDTSYRVQDLRGQLRTLHAKIESEQRNIHVLKAEWGFLTNPARIEMAARKHLKLSPMNTSQIASVDDLRDVLPSKGKAEASRTTAQIRLLSVATKANVTPSQASAAKIALDTEDSHINTHIVIQRTAHADVLSRRIEATTGSALHTRGTTP